MLTIELYTMHTSIDLQSDTSSSHDTKSLWQIPAINLIAFIISVHTFQFTTSGLAIKSLYPLQNIRTVQNCAGLEYGMKFQSTFSCFHLKYMYHVTRLTDSIYHLIHLYEMVETMNSVFANGKGIEWYTTYGLCNIRFKVEIRFGTRLYQ